MTKDNFKIKICLILTLLLLFGAVLLVEAAKVGDEDNFYIDSSYDLYNREEIEAQLLRISDSSYLYVDKSWWGKLTSKDKNRISIKLHELAEEFDEKIYPTLTSEFGSEWKPGIDNDNRVTVLFHLMKENDGGYFNNGDEYSRFQNPRSNQREMVYLNASYITNDVIKSFLAHEFLHLIAFNQKEKIQWVEEETWLNEARAEYAPTFCGYDSEYQRSNLQNRVNEFLKNPSDSITEWQGVSADYGALNVFIQYLVDHYGVKILTDSLHSSKVGIESINYALEKDGFKKDFSQIFTDWTIAVLVNDCSLGEKYCYKNENLKNIRIVPESNFLPLTSESSLLISHTTKNWAGNWQKIFGGKDTLTFEFKGGEGNNFKLPYLVCQDSNGCSINFLSLDENQKGEIILEDFNTKYTSLTIIPSLQNKFSGFDGIEPAYLFNWKATISNGRTEEDKETELIKQLLARIAYLKSEIAKVRSQIAAILGKTTVSCQKFDSNLYYGMMANSEVRCLQQFLKNQGAEIYPEGLVTGNFLSLTKAAVIRFQEEYAPEILAPLSLEKGTGYFGPLSREAANGLIHR
ncbi:peptidoglycan-binding protein [Patescibacteria group bacterium]|nr:peptidoglycan-binding protein [Patescibacteria group bacterium]